MPSITTVNVTHLHLLLNHVPTVGAVVALGLLLLALVRRDERLKHAGLEVLFAIAVLTLPVYLSGVAAHQKLRDQPGVSEDAMRVHHDAALADYQQTVLQALQQVADTLKALEDDAHALQARDEAAQQAQASLNIAHAQYLAGGVSQFGLLDTQRQALQSALDRTRAQADRFADTAALFQSLGGVMSKPADAGL